MWNMKERGQYETWTIWKTWEVWNREHVEHGERGQQETWYIDVERGKCRTWKMWNVENVERGKCGRRDRQQLKDRFGKDDSNRRHACIMDINGDGMFNRVRYDV